MKYITSVGDKKFTIDINRDGQITIDGQEITAQMLQVHDSNVYSIIVDGKSHDVQMTPGDGVFVVQYSGEIFEVKVEDERTQRLAGLKSGAAAIVGETIVKAPMPGVVIEVPVNVDQEIQKGDVLVIYESMKMQNEFKAPRGGKIKQIRIKAGDKVEQNAVMLIIV